MNTVKDLVESFRDDEKDSSTAPFWSDSQLVRWANMAVARFCEKTRSVYDSTSAFTLIDYRAGESVYPRHHCIIDIVQAYTTGPNGRDLEVQAPGYTSQKDLPRTGMTKIMVVDNADLRLYPAPQEDGQLQLEVIRRPVKTLTIDSKLSDVPTTEREHLLLYIKHRAYRVNDAEIFDPAKSANFLAEFDQTCQEYYETASAGRRSGSIRYGGL